MQPWFRAKLPAKAALADQLERGVGPHCAQRGQPVEVHSSDQLARTSNVPNKLVRGKHQCRDRCRKNRHGFWLRVARHQSGHEWLVWVDLNPDRLSRLVLVRHCLRCRSPAAALRIESYPATCIALAIEPIRIANVGEWLIASPAAAQRVL